MHFRSHAAHALSAVLLHKRHANRPSGESLEADNDTHKYLKTRLYAWKQLPPRSRVAKNIEVSHSRQVKSLTFTLRKAVFGKTMLILTWVLATHKMLLEISSGLAQVTELCGLFSKLCFVQIAIPSSPQVWSSGSWFTGCFRKIRANIPILLSPLTVCEA